MEELEKNILINKLFDLYGPLLSNTQQKMISLYYTMDLSLGEIAEQEGVSRNAVYDALKKGTESLVDYDSKLHLLEKEEKQEKLLEEIKKIVSEEEYQKIFCLMKEEE